MTGEAMRMRSDTYFYYKCPNTRLKSPTACRAPRVRAVEAEQAVWAAIGRVQLRLRYSLPWSLSMLA